MLWASFLPIFNLLRSSVLDLRKGTGHTDGQTDDGHQRLMPHTMGAEAFKNLKKTSDGFRLLFLADVIHRTVLSITTWVIRSTVT